MDFSQIESVYFTHMTMTINIDFFFFLTFFFFFPPVMERSQVYAHIAGGSVLLFL